MDFVFDLLQGAGIAAAVGIRPFLPTLLVGALAAGDVGIDFDGTDFSFLEQPAWLVAVIVLLALSIFAARRSGPDTLDRPPWAYLLATFTVVVGLLLAAGSLADHGESIVPGIIAGMLCASLGYVVARDLLGRTWKR